MSDVDIIQNYFTMGEGMYFRSVLGLLEVKWENFYFIQFYVRFFLCWRISFLISLTLILVFW